MKSLITSITSDWKLKLITVLSSLLVLSAIFKLLTPQKLITSQNTWNELNPGLNSAQDLKNRLGTPQKISRQKDQQIYEYEYRDDNTINTRVGINDNDTIIFIKERLKYNPNHRLTQYLEKWGEADLELYPSTNTGVVKTYVFLDEGVAIFAHQKDLSVEQKWYFIPTTKEIFLSSWKNELFAQEPGPESFPTSLLSTP